MSPGRCFVVGDPGDDRVLSFSEAARARGLAIAHVDYRDLLRDPRAALADVCPGDIVRLETPGRAADLNVALVAFGAELREAEGGRPVAGAALDAVAERGRLLGSRQWFLGFRRLLRRTERCLAGRGAQLVSHPEDVATMFDKPACHALLSSRAVRVPRSLGPVSGFDALEASMLRHGVRRVFVKLAHGSAGAGVLAFRRAAAAVQGWTTVEIATTSGETRLYNSRRIRHLSRAREIAAVVDALAPETVQVEEWIPRASLPGGVVDLRAVWMAGLGVTVARVARSPITNLHLGNERRPGQVIASRMGPLGWRTVVETVAAVAASFPRSAKLAADIAIGSGFRGHAVLEVNAFGDYLKEVTSEHETAYQREARLLGEAGLALGVA